MRKDGLVDEVEGGFRCARDPSLREEERFVRDDGRAFVALAFIDLARGFMTRLQDLCSLAQRLKPQAKGFAVRRGWKPRSFKAFLIKASPIKASLIKAFPIKPSKILLR